MLRVIDKNPFSIKIWKKKKFKFQYHEPLMYRSYQLLTRKGRAGSLVHQFGSNFACNEFNIAYQ